MCWYVAIISQWMKGFVHHLLALWLMKPDIWLVSEQRRGDFWRSVQTRGFASWSELADKRHPGDRVLSQALRDPGYRHFGRHLERGKCQEIHRQAPNDEYAGAIDQASSNTRREV